MPGSERTFGTIILGAGIVGSALAHHLNRRGESSVLLYDRDQPTAGASGKGAGILCAQCWNRWDIGLVRESLEEYRTISTEWGLGAFRQNGGLRSVQSARGERKLEERREEIRKEGVEARVLGPGELAELLPTGRFDDVRAALYTPHDAVISPPEITFAYAELASHHGTEVLWGHGLPTVARSNGKWRVTTLGGSYRSDRLVLACGAWTKRALRDLEAPLPLSPYRTQACRLRPRDPAALFPSFHDSELDVYTRPAPGGRLIAGDGTEDVETDPERANPAADFAFLEHIAASFRTRLPGWAGAAVEASWAGVCTATPDRYPVVGKVPGDEGLYVATGFNGFGVMRAGAIARRLAEGILQDRWTALAPALPDRFPDRRLVFPPRPGFTLD